LTVYAEASAVLAWLLDEPRAAEVAIVLGGTDGIVTSELTLIECDRVLHRLHALPGPVSAATDAMRARLLAAAEAWAVEPISGVIVERARAPFPDDAIRSLDAIHLATAVVVRKAVGELDVLSLDARIRSNARSLGCRVVPA
jgi:uncharacterized protein with PIN domain